MFARDQAVKRQNSGPRPVLGGEVEAETRGVSFRGWVGEAEFWGLSICHLGNIAEDLECCVARLAPRPLSPPLRSRKDSCKKGDINGIN